MGAAATATLVPAFVAGTGTTSATAPLSFTLESGASSCFFCDCTDLTPLHTPVTVVLADPSVGLIAAHSTTTLLCPAAPSRAITCYYTPSISKNLVGVSHLHDLGVITTFPTDEPVASCTVGQVMSGEVAAMLCDCRYAEFVGFFMATTYLATTSGMELVLGGSQPIAEVEIYAGAMAAQELRWLNLLLTDLGERPSFAPALFAENKVMILLYREPRLESRVKHINLRYFLLRELQRCGQTFLVFLASMANTADIFTKALPPSDHH
ncbi:unnamed protein product [Closterium sp. NIES-54]